MSRLDTFATSSGRGFRGTGLLALRDDPRGEGPFQCLLTLGSRETAAVRGTGTAHPTTSGQPRAADYSPDLSPVQVPKAGRSKFQNPATNQFLGTTILDMRRFPAGYRMEAA
jgi:hypothetical protein